MRPRQHFSGAALRAGLRASLPFQLGLLPFGLVCGVLAEARGLSLLEACLMSALCYSGTAQLLALGAWTHPAPVLGATLAALVVSLRFALMGPVLAPWLDRVRGWRLWGGLFLMADQNWALSVAEMQAGRRDAAYLFGSGAATWAAWVLATAAGFALGAAVSLPPGHPLFFATLAVFVALLVSLWRGRAQILPWAMAAAVAILVARLLPGTSWHIILGALAGSAAGALRDARA